MNKKILITGSNGLLGQKLVHRLSAIEGVQLIATSRGANRITRQTGYVYEMLDNCDEKAVQAVCDKYLPDVIINTAAMTNVDACEVQREECWAINVDSVAFFVNALERLQQQHEAYKPHFIHLSTDFVFDGQQGPYREEDQPHPLSYYAESKYASEQVLKQSKLHWAVARTIIVYGVAEQMSRSNVVLWAKSALEKGERISIVKDQFRMPTLAEDLAEGCILIARHGASGIYHLSGKDMMSIVELVYRVADFYGLDKNLVTPITTDSLNQAAARPPRTGFVLDKARRELGYEPRSFEEGLALITAQLKAGSEV